MINEINVQDYLKSIEDTTIISIEDNIKTHLKSQKYHNTLLEIQEHNKWKSPQGIKPSRAYTFDEIVSILKSNPNQPFSFSDVWVKTSLINVIPKFNRIPSVKKSIESLNFIGCLDWEALDTPHYYLAELDGKIVLISTIGGHRATMCVLSNGFGSELPAKITYVGSLDIGVVHDRCALIHHIDCNKRMNQTAEQRLTSGVEAGDKVYVQHFKNLVYCKLYHEVDQRNSKSLLGHREISSWMNFVGTVKSYSLHEAKWATEQLIKNTEDGEKIISQAVETLACIKYHFNSDINKVNPGKDVFAEFIRWYFNDSMSTQADLRSEGDNIKNCLKLIDRFNRWSKKVYNRRYSPITSTAIIEVFDESISLS
jgi:hypothetical protein